MVFRNEVNRLQIQLTEEEQKTIEEFSEKIDLNNRAQILQYGSSGQNLKKKKFRIKQGDKTMGDNRFSGIGNDFAGGKYFLRSFLNYYLPTLGKTISEFI